VTATWYLVPYRTASGAVQMALDNWLLEQHSLKRLTQPILRFYSWSPPAISLGYHQRHIPDHWTALGLDIVRRPSGGRAVLHVGDLSYAIITSALAGSRQDSYRYLCEFLRQGFASLDIHLTYGQSGRGYIGNPSCFSTATDSDLIVAGCDRKLIGSAQVYRRQSLLQHGSISITPDHHLLSQVFAADVPVVGLTDLVDTVSHTSPLARWDRQTALTPLLIETLIIAAAHCFQAQFVELPHDHLKDFQSPEQNVN
jgi:lipoate-protein ligase A